MAAVQRIRLGGMMSVACGRKVVKVDEDSKSLFMLARNGENMR